ncbi:hypothetical protein BDV41DRAFT_558767 [Aspergillus transmontanensis]|uniref:Uncharacterized protein n=1 Tax=Aspergillus transmontanensis TaxID=1034304 RepID=A0A5N6VD59_9EURO|nr:hypothetical protein BDV41DRAFT_558767 [Aspergillus transmontanensis]
MDLPSEWLCSIQLFALYAGSLASMLTGFLIDGQTSLVSLLLYRTLVGSLGRLPLIMTTCVSGFVLFLF